MTTKTIDILFGFLLIIFFPLTLRAEPYHISLDELVTTSQAIFIGNYEGPINKGSTHLVEISAVLKGSIPLGKNDLKQQEGHSPRLKLHQNFVGFLDQKGSFLFAALPVNDSDLDGALIVSGFYDFNAYLVSPSLITLDQLKNFIKGDKKLRYHFKGDVYFLKEGDAEITPSNHQMEVDYTYGDKTVTVNGLNFLKGFQLKPASRITSWEHGPHIFLDYKLNYERPLELVGEVIGYDKKEDIFITQFWSSQPKLLAQKQWEKYVQNDQLKTPYYEIKVSLKNGETWKLWMDKKDSFGFYLDGFRQGKFDVTETSLAPQRYLKIPLHGDGNLWIYMNPAKIKFKDYYGIDSFIQELFYAPIECEVVLEASKTPMPKTSCTMTLLSINYN